MKLKTYTYNEQCIRCQSKEEYINVLAKAKTITKVEPWYQEHYKIDICVKIILNKDFGVYNDSYTYVNNQGYEIISAKDFLTKYKLK